MITGSKSLSMERFWPRVIIVGMDNSAKAPGRPTWRCAKPARRGISTPRPVRGDNSAAAGALLPVFLTTWRARSKSHNNDW
jgi:hypothetical protein